MIVEKKSAKNINSAKPPNADPMEETQLSVRQEERTPFT